MPLWSQDELSDVFNCVASTGPVTTVLCSVLGLTKGQIDGIRRRYPEAWAEAVERWDEKHPRLPLDLKNKHLKENIQLRQTQSELKKQLDSAIKEQSLAETIKNAIEASVAELPPATAYPVKNYKSGVTKETLVAVVADLHAGEIVKPSLVKGLGEYNSRVCQARIGHYFKKVVELKQKLEAGGHWEFEELCLPILGDLTMGTMHLGEMHSDENIIRTCAGVASMLSEGIAWLAQEFPEIHCLCIVGNHGRGPDQRKKDHKDPTRNFDWLIYAMMAKALKQIPNVKMFYPESYTIQARIRGWLFQLDHGDNIKGALGIPFYGFDRFAKGQNSIEASRGQHVDAFLMGHWHQETKLEVGNAELLVSGSVKGVDEFTLSGLGKMSRPSQLMFGVNEKHGITHRWTIKLDNPDPDSPLFNITPWEGDNFDPSGEEILVYNVG